MRFICPLFGEPPIDAATFDIRDHNGLVSDHVFEYTTLFRHIGTRGVGSAVRKVTHPLTSASIHRSDALARVIRVSPALQERINAERSRLGLGFQYDTGMSITDAHRAQYASKIEISLREETHVDEWIVDTSSDDDSVWSSSDDILSILGPTRNIHPRIAGRERPFEGCRNAVRD